MSQEVGLVAEQAVPVTGGSEVSARADAAERGRDDAEGRAAEAIFQVAEFEADLIRMRTREGMAVARAKGKLRGKKPKLSDRQSRELRRMYDTSDYSISDLAEVFSVSRPTVYRTLQRHPAAT